MSEQLWTDERMMAAYVAAFERNPDVHHWALLCEVRDDLQAHIAALEAQLAEAQRWEPVSDGEYRIRTLYDSFWIIIRVSDGREIEQWRDYEKPDKAEVIMLPSDWRLCRRAEKGAE